MFLTCESIRLPEVNKKIMQIHSKRGTISSPNLRLLKFRNSRRLSIFRPLLCEAVVFPNFILLTIWKVIKVPNFG